MESVTKGTGWNFSLRSVLLIVLIVGFGVGLAVYTLANAFAIVTGFARGASPQSSGGSTSTGGTHNCTRTSG